MAEGYGFITTQPRAGFKPIIGHQGPPRPGGFQIRIPDNGARKALAAQGTPCKVCDCPLEFAGRRWGVSPACGNHRRWPRPPLIRCLHPVLRPP